MASRTSSRNSKTSVGSGRNRYRTKASSSEVDDMLFGSTTAQKIIQEKRIKPLLPEETVRFTAGTALPKHAQTKTKKRKPETVRVITKDLIRDVVIPSEDSQNNSIILKSTSYNTLQEKAFTNINEEALRHNKNQVEREKIQQEMQKRKALMNEYDLKRSENHPLNDLEVESRTIAEELLKRSQAKRLEENDEIKTLNELILEAKCHAIRDAQISEKKDLFSQMNEENDRLDAMMEIDRVEAIKQQEAVDRRRKEQRQQGAVQILQQIEVNRLAKTLDQERKDQEARMLVENQRKLQLQDLAAIELKRREQQKLQTEIDIINKEHQRQKAIQHDQERLSDLRVVKYQQDKAAREEKYDEEQKQLSKIKEGEISKLRAAQERASDLLAERDALRAKRHEEATEREYRRKAREEAAKKQAIDSEMDRAREEQIQAKRHLMAIQAARERAEFDNTLDEQRKQVIEMAKSEEVKHQQQRKYAEEVRSQIRERESERITARKAFFDETIQLDRDIEAKNRDLDEVKKAKLKSLKESGVPEKYVLEVARHTNGLKTVI